MKKIKSKLKDIPKTMLIPLRARYLETKRENGIIHDPKTVEILDQIDYDWSGKNEVSKSSQMGVSIRTEILDEQTIIFLSKNKNALVVNLGCGLDTRFHRLNNGSVIWFDLDTPEAIELRKKFFKETDRFKFISKSILDFSCIAPCHIAFSLRKLRSGRITQHVRFTRCTSLSHFYSTALRKTSHILNVK